MLVPPDHPTPPEAQAQAHDTQAQTQAQAAQAHAQLERLRTGCLDVFCEGGGVGMIEFANFSRLTTMLFAVPSTAVAMLFAKSAPGIFGGTVGPEGGSVLGL